MTEAATGQAIVRMQTNRYLTVAPDPHAKLRLFCFHEGGAAASSFSAWRNSFGSDISVIPIQLPGHGNRHKETLIPERSQLIGEVNKYLRAELDAPYSFYGHCMGALLAYNLTLLRVRNNERLPECLLTGACKAPPVTSPWITQYINLPDDELASFLSSIGLLSPSILNNPERLSPALALATHDARIFADCQEFDPLPCPIHAFVGDADYSMSPQDNAAWATLTTEKFTTHTISGSHLFNIDPTWELIDQITRLLHGYIHATE
jgi:surfactin synthase thioesterase subunit